MRCFLMNKLYYIIGVFFLLLFASCKPTTPEQYIQPDDMEDILVDYYLAMAMAGESNERVYNQEYYLESVLAKHGVTREEYDSSMVYYYTRADRSVKLYTQVAERLEDQALSLGATESEIGKYSSLNAEGDTANIWKEKTMMVMRPTPPYNRFDFTITADSTFQRGDSFLMQFMADFMFQDGAKNALVYIAVDYPDTTITFQHRYSYAGLNQMHVETRDTVDFQQIRGFFYVGGANEQTTTLRLIFISNLQFIRFHKEHHEPEPSATDSVASVDSIQRTVSATNGSRTAFRSGRKLLSLVRRTAFYGMAQRANPYQT